MELRELIKDVERASRADDPLERLSTAVIRHAELTDQADQLLDHFVRAAREARCSWAQIGEVLGVTKQAAQQRHAAAAGRGLLGWLRKGRGSSRLFSRFTDRARRAVLEARQAARELGHNYVGTEHVLIGILSDRDSLASKVLARYKIDRSDVVDDVVNIIGRGSERVKGHTPFTPRAKKVLDLSLREAIRLGDNYIGTEHILLGLLAEKEGVAAQILANRGVTTDMARTAVTDLLAAMSDQSNPRHL